MEKTEKMLTGRLFCWRFIFLRTFSKIPECTASCFLFSIFKNLTNRRLTTNRENKFPVSLTVIFLFKLPVGCCCVHPQVLVMLEDVKMEDVVEALSYALNITY